MKQKSNKMTENGTMNSPNCVAIMAILAEMARCVNENISKVQLAPLDQSLTTLGSTASAELLALSGKQQ